jgi:hypothetical protein
MRVFEGWDESLEEATEAGEEEEVPDQYTPEGVVEPDLEVCVLLFMYNSDHMVLEVCVLVFMYNSDNMGLEVCVLVFIYHSDNMGLEVCVLVFMYNSDHMGLEIFVFVCVSSPVCGYCEFAKIS